MINDQRRDRQTIHKAMASAYGMTIIIRYGSEDECKHAAQVTFEKPFLDDNGAQIGTVDKTWIELA